MRKRVSNYFLGVVIICCVYLVVLALVGHSEEVNPFFYYGFWLTLGVVLGFRLGIYLYEKGLSDQSKEKRDTFNKELENQGRLN